MDAFEIAEQNLERHLRRNSYPGRGLVVGRSTDNGEWLLIYWIMGRSKNSQNRRFVSEGPVLRTEPLDPDQVADPSLIIYEAMLELPGLYLVGNGDQVRVLYDTLRTGGTFDEAMARCEREPDAPHYTPRITALLDLRSTPKLSLSILKANPANPELTDRFTYRPASPPPGLGVGLTTYMGDGNPLPPFNGDPLLLPCIGNAQAVLDTYWNALDVRNRVALAVKRIASDGTGEILVRNRRER